MPGRCDSRQAAWMESKKNIKWCDAGRHDDFQQKERVSQKFPKNSL